MLTSAQQASLDYHLRETNLLTNEELILELTDHYTTAHHERITQGMTFEKALIDIQQAFGGRKGLQKMERQYNKVTFRRYDSVLMNYVREQGKWPEYLVPLIVFSFAFWIAVTVLKPVPFSFQTVFNSFGTSLSIGFLVGIVLGLPWWNYFKSLIKQGFHNVPTKVVYMLTRFGSAFALIFVFACMSAYVAPYLPFYLGEVLLAICFVMVSVLVRSHRLMYDRFFKIE